MHPLIQRLLASPGAAPVTAAGLDAWMAGGGNGDGSGGGSGGGARVLFFSGDPVRFPEALDVAVVLPELRAALGGRFEIGVVLRADEDALARRFGVQRWPSLVFLRDGAYVDTVAGMKDWDDYLRAAAAALEAPARRAPTVGIAVVAAGAAPSCHAPDGA